MFLPLLYKRSYNANISQLTFCNEKNKKCRYQIFDKKITSDKIKKNDFLEKNTVLISMKVEKSNSKNLIKNQLISEKKIQLNLSKSLKPQSEAWNTKDCCKCIRYKNCSSGYG